MSNAADEKQDRTGDGGVPVVHAYRFGERDGTDASYDGTSVLQLIGWGRLHRDEQGGFSFAAMASGQLSAAEAPVLDPKATRVENPNVDPVAYRELYRRDATHRACVDAKVAYIVGQGYRLRPVTELHGNDQFSGELVGKEPDKEQKQRALKFLAASEPEYSLTQLLCMAETDRQSEGNCYIELARDAAGVPERMYYVPAETMRILADYSGFVQVRGQRKAFWARYGTGQRTLVVTKTGAGDSPEARFVGMSVDKYGLAERTDHGQALDLWYAKAKPGDERVTTVNEMMHFKVFTPRDTVYGEPCIISAIEDFLGNQNMKLMTLMYFDRCGVPRLSIVIEGDELSDKTVENLKKWAQSQDKLEAMNEILVLQVPPGTTAKFEKLASEQLQDAAFMEYRRMNDEAMMRAHRTPESIIATAANSNRAESAEANNKFIKGVVRPAQELYMSAINYILRNELGVTDWVFDLNVPDIETEKTKAEIADIYLRRGVDRINDVRRGRGQESMEGGDFAFVLVPGTGVVRVDRLAALGDGEVAPKVIGAEGQKTPEKGADIEM